MKKIVFTFLAVASMMVTAQKKSNTPKSSKAKVQASSHTKKKVAKKGGAFTIGVKGGGNFTQISGNDKYRNLKSKIGFYGGVLGNYNLGDKMALQMEALYQAAGAKVDMKDNTDVKGVWNLNYIAVPILFQYEVLPQFYLETGPEFQVIVKSNQVITDKAGTNIASETDFKDYTHPLIFAWDFGAGYRLTSNLSIDARYSFGLNSPYKESENGDAKSFRNSNFQLGLSYRFR